MLNQFFELNRLDEEALGVSARDCYYQEIPKYFCWDESVNRWQPRKRALKTVGRIHFVSIHQGERYYIRLILTHRKDIRSWIDLRSAHGIVYPDFRAAAEGLGLLLNDAQYNEALKEGERFKTGFQLRLMFAIILVYSPPAAPMTLFHGHWRNLGDDLAYVLRTSYGIFNATTMQLKAFTLYQIGQILSSMGTSLEEVSLRMMDEEIVQVENIVSCDFKASGFPNYKDDWIVSSNLLNSAQQHFYDVVLKALFEDK
jgi:hypothetical protein